MIKEAILKLSKKVDLTAGEARSCMNEIMNGEASDVQMSSYLTALSLKGETIDEITGSAAGMREHCIKLLNDKDVLEIVGTGGDGSNSFNISTTSSLVIAASGVKVAKHGNRAASSKCGAADVLEALGVKIDVTPEKSATILNDINICFLFAQNYHIAMKYVAPVRRELGIRTVFNILGPLTNPAGANMQVMGVYEEALVEPLAEVLTNLGVKRAMVVYGQDSLDEISLSAPTSVCEVKDGTYTRYTITPEQFGLTRCCKEELVGGTPKDNAKITRDILSGVKGPKRDAVLLNAGAAIYIAGRTKTMQEGIELAARLIDDGKRASPSKGVIAPNFDYKSIAKEYEDIGAAAISVVTEPDFFKGDDDFLAEIAKIVKIPVLRKDFVVDEYMIYEAKLLGADAVLLICSILDEITLMRCLNLAERLGMSALVEAHSSMQVKKALRVGAKIIGVNNRDLRNFEVDLITVLNYVRWYQKILFLFLKVGLRHMMI